MIKKQHLESCLGLKNLKKYIKICSVPWVWIPPIMVFFSLRKIRSISIVIVQVLVIKSCTMHDSQAGLLVLVLRILEHGPNLGIPGQQQIQVNKANLS